MTIIDTVLADITTMRVDAIVNPANTALRGGGGVDGAIHRAGGPSVLADCVATFPAGLATGDAGATTGGDLHARWVIHTVAPNYTAGQHDRALLASCYTSVMEVADRVGARSVAFPLIGAGAYGWPQEEAVTTALESIAQSSTGVERVTLVARDTDVQQAIRRGMSRWTPLRILQGVGVLHERGVHAARVLPGMSASGMYWRIAIAPAQEFEDQGGYLGLRDWERALTYTTGDQSTFLRGEVDISTSPVQVADLIRASCPLLSTASTDTAYVEWYEKLLRIVEAVESLPVAYADYYDHAPAWEVGWGSGILYPPPPERP